MRLPSFRPRSVFSLIVIVLLAPSPAGARSRGKTTDSAAAVHGTAECAALFGSNAERTQHAQARRRIYWVHEELEGITIAHSSEFWSEPTEVEIKGLHLVRSEPGRAVIRVQPSLAGPLHCPVGDYAVREDDAIGRGTSVLSVLQAGVLFERGGRLAYLRAPTVRSTGPRWLLAWGAPGTVKVPEDQTITVRSHIRYIRDE